MEQFQLAYHLLRACNHAIANLTDETVLLQEICHLLTSIGGYRFVWIGYIEPDGENKLVHPIAQSGNGQTYLQSVIIKWDESEFGQGPTGKAIRTRHPYIVQDILADATYIPWRTQAMQYGYHAVASFPIHSQTELLGVLNVYAGEKGAFNELAVDILETFALSLSQGILTSRMRQNYQNAEQELRTSEQRFRLLAENARDIIFRFRLLPQLGFEYVSPVVTEMTGYTPEDHYNDPQLGFKLVHPDDRHLLAALMKDYEFKSPIVVRWVCHDGRVIWTEQRIVPIYDNGIVVAIEGIARDITLQKIVEEELHRTNEHLRNIFDNLDHVFFSFDVKLHQTLWISSACQKVYGFSMVDFHRSPNLFHQVIFPDDLPYVREQEKKYGNGEMVSFVYRIMRQDGELRWVEAKIKPVLDEKRELIRLDGIVADITERRRSARLVIAGELATSVAHQINNPLTAVIAESHLLLAKLPPNTEIAERAQEIKEAAYRAAHIVQRLLDLARTPSTHLMLLNVNESLHHALHLMRHQLEVSQIRLITDFSWESLFINGNEESLQDVWMNLLMNAKEVLENTSGGEIKVTTVWQKDQGKIEISFQDNGAGIPPETLDYIFTPFFTTKKHGTGLGLSVCHEVISQHSGTIGVISHVMKGTTFTVSLPCAM